MVVLERAHPTPRFFEAREGNALSFGWYEWRNWLRHSEFGLSRKERRWTSHFMAEFTHGAQDAYAYHVHERHLPAFPMPTLRLVTGANDLETASYDIGSNTVLVNLDNVKTAAARQGILPLLRAWLAQRRHPSTATRLQEYLALTDLFYGTGVEECDHAAFSREHPATAHTVNLKGGSVPEGQYFAQPHEYRALQTELILAKRSKRHVAIQVLQACLSAADRWRREHPEV